MRLWARGGGGPRRRSQNSPSLVIFALDWVVFLLGLSPWEEDIFYGLVFCLHDFTTRMQRVESASVRDLWASCPYEGSKSFFVHLFWLQSWVDEQFSRSFEELLSTSFTTSEFVDALYVKSESHIPKLEMMIRSRDVPITLILFYSCFSSTFSTVSFPLPHWFPQFSCTACNLDVIPRS